MTPKERVLTALDHKEPDRIPWAVPPVGFLSQLTRHSRDVSPQHRDVFPAHDLKDVAVVHPTWFGQNPSARLELA